MRNEKYKGDVLLQKSYTVDYLTKTTAKNKGEVTQYYIENNHESIVSREIFDMVQDELQRRASLYSSKTPSKYSSKYALTGKAFCGECGAKYRRVTWSRNGKKKIVWRCTERLTNGTKNCKDSPTILEEDLHNAILDSLKGMLPNSEYIAEKVKKEIKAILLKNDSYNLQLFKDSVQNCKREEVIIRGVSHRTDDELLYVDSIKGIEEEVKKLNYISESESILTKSNSLVEINNVINELAFNIDIHFHALAKQAIQQITISGIDTVNISLI